MKRETKVDNEKFGQALSDAFQDAPACGALGPFDDLHRRRVINDVLAAVSSDDTLVREDAIAHKKSPGTLVWGAAAGFILLCTVAATYWFLMPPATSPLVETYFGEVQKIEGGLYINNAAVLDSAPIPVGKSMQTNQGSALMRLPTGIDWWMGNDTGSHISALDTDQVQVTVKRGESWFRVNPKRSGPAFSVVTEIGRVDVTGTIFVVKAGPSETRVTLLKGEVWVTRNTGQRYFVEEGNTLRLRDGMQLPLEDTEKMRMHAQLVALNWETGTAPAPSEIGERKALTPGPGAIEAAGALTEPVGSPAAKQPTAVTPRALLNEVQVERKNRNWGKVETLYRRLIKSAPGSQTAVVSGVSLGEVYLTRLHRYGDALQQFNKYIRSGHTALLPEAVYGKCKSLKALGRRQQELQCLTDFARRFDGAMQMPEVEARLDALR